MLRWVVRVVLAVVVLAVLIAASGVFNGWWKMRARHANPPSTLTAATDSASLARGEHLARIACSGCHSPDGGLPLSGSPHNILHVPGGPTFGQLQPSNLTPGGVLAHATDGELARAIREGVGRDGRALLVMPSAQYHSLSDRDVRSLLGFLRSQPAVDSVRTPRALNPLGYALLGFGVFPPSAQPPITTAVADPPTGVDPGHGEYLAGLLACRDCHGADLRGGRKGQLAPVGPDLGALCAAHPVDAFDRALREGISPTTGRSLDPTLMPFTVFNALERVEVEALYAYLRGLATDTGRSAPGSTP